MGRHRKATNELFYDQFAAFPLDEQAIAIRIMTEMHRQAVKLKKPWLKPELDKSELDLGSLDDVRKSVGKETGGN